MRPCIFCQRPRHDTQLTCDSDDCCVRVRALPTQTLNDIRMLEGLAALREGVVSHPVIHLTPREEQRPSRCCKIVAGSIGSDIDAGDDGAYDLFDAVGTPMEIGTAIAYTLATVDILRGGRTALLEDQRQPIYLCLTICIAPDKESMPSKEELDG